MQPLIYAKITFNEINSIPLLLLNREVNLGALMLVQGLTVKGVIALCEVIVLGFIVSVGLNIKLGIHYSNTKQVVEDQEVQAKVITTLKMKFNHYEN